MAEEKSLGKKILSFFIEEEAQTTQAPKAVQTPASQQTAFVPNATESETVAGRVDKKFADHFVEVLEKSNLQGPDYFEFMNALKSLSGLGLSEDKQFQAAWASFKAMGNVADISVLTTTANQYIGLLDNDRQGFLKDVDTAITERVGGLQSELKQMQSDNENMAKQIIELQNKINENNAKVNTITNDISEQSSKITGNKNNYEITYNSFVDKIKGDIQKIKHYLA